MRRHGLQIAQLYFDAVYLVLIADLFLLNVSLKQLITWTGSVRVSAGDTPPVVCASKLRIAY